MVLYIVAFFAVALFPLALAGMGAHLATLAVTNPKERSRWKLGVWALAVAGVGFEGLQQVAAYESDKDHDKKQDGLRSKLDTSIQSEENIKGRLQTLAFVFSKLENNKSNAFSADDRKILGALVATAVQGKSQTFVPNATLATEVDIPNNVLRTMANNAIARLESAESDYEHDGARIEQQLMLTNADKGALNAQKFRKAVILLDYNRELLNEVNFIRLQIIKQLGNSYKPHDDSDKPDWGKTGMEVLSNAANLRKLTSELPQ
jgi:hypothetical protein